MQTLAAQTKRRAALVLALVAVLSIAAPSRVHAQNVWDKIKQEAKQAAQPQKQQQTPQQQNAPAQSANPAYQTVAASGVTSGSDPDSSCCTAAAMKTMAAQAGSVDMVGIKLGMTPQQATAAIKAHNPALRLYQVNMRLYHPGAKNFIAVPHYIVATNNPPGRELPVGQEVIVLEFTTPPNSPVLTMASRYTSFAPTLAGNLVKELEKKYGPEYPRQGPLSWVYDSSGKPVTTPSSAADGCAAILFGPLGGQPQFVNGTAPAQDSDSGAFDVTTYKNAQSSGSGPKPACMPYTLVQTMNIGTGVGPNTSLTQITVTMSNGGLNYAAMRSTADWLQNEADAQAKAAHDAAQKNTGTTF